LASVRWYVVAPEGEVWWFANVPRRGEPALGELDSIDRAEWRARLRELFAGDAGPATELIEGLGQFALQQRTLDVVQVLPADLRELLVPAVRQVRVGVDLSAVFVSLDRAGVATDA
jgi:hypothetical protein